jgi:predicted nicotinamide N-methyase
MTMKLFQCLAAFAAVCQAVSGWMTFPEYPAQTRSVPTGTTNYRRLQHRLFSLEGRYGNVLRLGLTADHAEQERKRRRIKLAGSGKYAHLRSRTLVISPDDWTITVWEWEQPAKVVESYWENQAAQIGASGLEETSSSSRVLDPFGLVSWPGSVVAAQALQSESSLAVQGRSVLILGAGVGVEAQAVAELGASKILATDIHPTTLQQLELGIKENERIQDKGVVKTQIFDVTGDDPLPMPSADLIIVADVLYNEQLASQVVRRLVEGWKRNPEVKILVTDSQRFVDFMSELELRVAQHSSSDLPAPTIDFSENTLAAFTGSGVCIDDDQTYDVKVRRIWIGLE